ncbi:MAG TPA: adenylate kinase [Candidatus Baltobacteraceae bacterium]|jgi:adenylate kinase|nr:adenylate kinase [Candidatus Baltobacteraceae bacterium]
MRLIFLGPPGAGKGTQAQILQQRFGAKQVSTGDILRENRAKGTQLGKLAESYMNSGALVPDEVIIKMIEAELDTLSDGFIMDGFPRTVAQAEAFDCLLQSKNMNLDAVVLFEADRQTLLTRLTGRWTNPRTGRTYNAVTNPPRVAGIDDEDGGPLVQRDDDKLETVTKRLDVYENQTAPLVEYYRRSGKLVRVNALAPVADVTKEIVSKIAAGEVPNAAR